MEASSTWRLQLLTGSLLSICWFPVVVHTDAEMRLPTRRLGTPERRMRLTNRAMQGWAGPRELMHLARSLDALPQVREAIIRPPIGTDEEAAAHRLAPVRSLLTRLFPRNPWSRPQWAVGPADEWVSQIPTCKSAVD